MNVKKQKKEKDGDEKPKFLGFTYLAHESCEQRLKTASFYNECLAIRCP